MNMEIQNKLLKAGILDEILLQFDSLSTNGKAEMSRESYVMKRKQCRYLRVGAEDLLHDESVQLGTAVSGSGEKRL